MMKVRNVISALRNRQSGKLTPIALSDGMDGKNGTNGTNGTNGSNGANGWTPVLAPEQDGTRTLLKVMDWANGSGTKPATGMYLATSGYVTAKADAFNFNAAKRVFARSAQTNAQGVAAIVFGVTPAFTAPPVVIPLPATTAVLSGPTRSTVSNVTVSGCSVTVQQQTVLSGVVSLLAGATANVLVIEA